MAATVWPPLEPRWFGFPRTVKSGLWTVEATRRVNGLQIFLILDSCPIRILARTRSILVSPVPLRRRLSESMTFASFFKAEVTPYCRGQEIRVIIGWSSLAAFRSV